MENEMNKDDKYTNSSDKRRRVYPNSDDALRDDLVHPEEAGKGDGMQVKSTEPDTEEWQTREDVNSRPQ